MQSHNCYAYTTKNPTTNTQGHTWTIFLHLHPNPTHKIAIYTQTCMQGSLNDLENTNMYKLHNLNSLEKTNVHVYTSYTAPVV